MRAATQPTGTACNTRGAFERGPHAGWSGGAVVAWKPAAGRHAQRPARSGPRIPAIAGLHAGRRYALKEVGAVLHRHGFSEVLDGAVAAPPGTTGFQLHRSSAWARQPVALPDEPRPGRQLKQDRDVDEQPVPSTFSLHDDRIRYVDHNAAAGTLLLTPHGTAPLGTCHWKPTGRVAVRTRQRHAPGNALYAARTGVTAVRQRIRATRPLKPVRPLAGAGLTVRFRPRRVRRCPAPIGTAWRLPGPRAAARRWWR